MNAEPYSYNDALWGRRFLIALAILICLKEVAAGLCWFVLGLQADPLWLPGGQGSWLFANRGALTLGGKLILLLLSLRRSMAARWSLGAIYLASAAYAVFEVLKTGPSLAALPPEAWVQLGNGAAGLLIGFLLLSLMQLRANEVVLRPGGTTVAIGSGARSGEHGGPALPQRLRAFVYGFLGWVPVLAILAALAYVNGLAPWAHRLLRLLSQH